MRWGRIILAVVLAEVAAVLVLVLIVAVLGPSESAAAAAYAQRLGRWVGPIGGGAATFLAALWAARGNSATAATQVGLWVGVLAAALDVAILVLSGAGFEWLLVLSNGIRIGAGFIGGRLAAQKPVPAPGSQ